MKLSLEEARKISGLTQEKVAYCIGSTVEEIKSYEQYNEEVELIIGVKLARLYEMPLKYIRFSKENKAYL